MTNTLQKKERIIEFDILRSIACLMVIMMHSPMPSAHANGLFLSTLSYLTAPCIGLFFMISGALLLPVKNTSLFIKKRFTKIFFPTLFWSLFYLLLNSIKTEFSLVLFIREILSIPFSPQGNGVLWFVYTMMGLYLVSPIISKWLENSSEKEIRFYLLLWLVSLCYPLLDSFLFLSTNNTSIIYYFSGYLGYYVLGFYLRKYPYSIANKWIIFSCLISLLAPALCKLLHLQVDFYSVFWYLSVFTASLCVGWFKLIFRVAPKLTNKAVKAKVVIFSNLSLGVYLVHIFIMRSYLWKLEWIVDLESYFIQTFIIIFLTLILSVLVCWGISHLPKSDYIIGYRYVKK